MAELTYYLGTVTLVKKKAVTLLLRTAAELHSATAKIVGLT